MMVQMTLHLEVLVTTAQHECSRRRSSHLLQLAALITALQYPQQLALLLALHLQQMAVHHLQAVQALQLEALQLEGLVPAQRLLQTQHHQRVEVLLELCCSRHHQQHQRSPKRMRRFLGTSYPPQMRRQSTGLARAMTNAS